MDIREFAIEWMRKKWPEDHTQIITDDVLEFAKAWGDHRWDEGFAQATIKKEMIEQSRKKHAVDFVMWNEMRTAEWREICEETYDDWIEELKEVQESKTPPSEP